MVARAVRVMVAGGGEAMGDLVGRALVGLPACSWEAEAIAAEGFAPIDGASFDVVVAHASAAPSQDEDLVEAVHRARPDVPIVLISPDHRSSDAADIAPRGVVEVLVEPVDPGHLREAILRAANAPIEPPASRLPHSSQRTVSRALLGQAPPILAMLEAIERIAQSSAPVLVVGETGTGKDVVASRIHDSGPRRTRPYVAVNTTAIPATLLESELFGHVRGAFTGATQARRGLLAEADGGTLFLDEIGDMPIELQGTLLRVIETGEVRAVGSDRGRRVDVRIVAATHRNLPNLVQNGRFREDLYHRLNVLAIHVPPLRERRGDIPSLVRHFVDLARSRTSGSCVTGVSPEALQRLMRAPWPGNVRQLAATMERLVVLGKSPRIEVTDLGFLADSETPDAPFSDAMTEPCTLKELTERYIGWVLSLADNDKARAAAILGIDISTLYRWQRRGLGAPESRPSRRRA